TEGFCRMQQSTGKKSREDAEFLASIGRRIAEARGEMSQERFAAKIDRSARTLGAWENGSNVGVLDLKKIAEASGRNLLWLLAGSDPWKSEKPAPPLVRESKGQAYQSKNQSDEDAPGDGLKG